MKKGIAIIIILLVSQSIGSAQEPGLNSIKRNWSIASNDTSRVMALVEFANYYKMKRPDSAMFYGAKALTLARQIKYLNGELRAMHHIVLTQIILGNNAKALQIALQAIKIAEKHKRNREIGEFLFFQGMIYKQSKNYEKALSFFLKAKNHYDSINDVTRSSLSQSFIGGTYLFLNNTDSALFYCQSSYDNPLKEKWTNYQVAFNLGKVQLEIGNSDLALALFHESLLMASEPSHLFDSNLTIAQLYKKISNHDSCIYYGEKSLLIAEESKFLLNIIDANIFLSSIYENTDIQKAFQYSKIAIAYKDSLYDLANKTAQETFLGFDAQERQQEIGAAHAEFKNRLWMNAFSGISFTLLVITIFLFWNSRLKQRAKRNIEKAYNQLKTTQAQLIQSEKMASLGELTAGIAHEIQNPLNFVNNFSEVNTELIEEMKQELEKGNIAEVKSIAEDIAENEKKIAQHGKRADSIVKGMLQHSRKSSGIKEPTDINALADEFLRLTYHGLKAKDKSFNATIKSDFDPSIDKVNVASQEMGRVFMNLFNNAFYAVNEKRKLNRNGYEPTVTVSTKKLKDKVEIKVSDNGNGIPQALLDKVFQPFFTTKPSGEGTGLGLSLSYDIVTKGHGGELKVDTKEGEYTTFIISLPI